MKYGKIMNHQLPNKLNVFS